MLIIKGAFSESGEGGEFNDSLTLRTCLCEREKMRHICGLVQFSSKYFFRDHKATWLRQGFKN